MEKNYDINKSIKAQKEYCEKIGAPHFAPGGGICWRCYKNIYEPQVKVHENPFSKEKREYVTGITVEEAGESLVTGCPHCNRTYCD